MIKKFDVQTTLADKFNECFFKWTCAHWHWVQSKTDTFLSVFFLVILPPFISIPGHMFSSIMQDTLRIPDSYDAKIEKICNFWTSWPVFQLINCLINKQKAFLPNDFAHRCKKCSNLQVYHIHSIQKCVIVKHENNLGCNNVESEAVCCYYANSSTYHNKSFTPGGGGTLGRPVSKKLEMHPLLFITLISIHGQNMSKTKF